MVRVLLGQPDRSDAMTTIKARAKGDSRPLSGVEKVAILLLALGRPKAAQLLRRMDREEVRLIAQVAKQLPPISSEELEQLVDEFANSYSSGIRFVGTAEEIRNLLSEVMAEEEIDDILSPPASSEEPVWSKLGRIKDDILRSYLLREHPQTAAVILLRLNSQLAARLMGSLPSELRNALLIRMVGTKTIAPEALAVLEQTLAEDLITLETPAAGAHAGIAEILNRLDKPQLDGALRDLGQARPADTEVIRGMLFTFEDLPLLAPKALSLVMNQIPLDKLVLALNGTATTFQEAVLGALPTRSRRIVELELQAESDASEREIADARRLIADTVLRLASQRKITLPNAA